MLPRAKRRLRAALRSPVINRSYAVARAGKFGGLQALQETLFSGDVCRRGRCVLNGDQAIWALYTLARASTELGVEMRPTRLRDEGRK